MENIIPFLKTFCQNKILTLLGGVIADIKVEWQLSLYVSIVISNVRKYVVSALYVLLFFFALFLLRFVVLIKH